MMIHALELFEREIDWLERNGGEFSKVEIGSVSFYALLAAALPQTVLVGSMPYIGLILAQGVAEDYAWVRTAPQWKIKKFVPGPGGKGVRAIGWSTSRRSMVKLGVAKVGSRFIPYVGWALLAYDAYSVAKWAKEKISN